MFRYPNVPLELVEENKNELQQILEQIQNVDTAFKTILKEINSVSFELNPGFQVNTFGCLHSNLDQNLCRFEGQSMDCFGPSMEREKSPSCLSIEGNQISNFSSCNVFTNTSNIDPTQRNSNGSSSGNADSMNNSCDENNETECNDETEVNFNMADDMEIEINDNSQYFVSFSKSNQKSKGLLNIFNSENFEKVKEHEEPVIKFNCMEVFQNNKIFIGSNGGQIKMYILNKKELVLLKNFRPHKKRINFLKVLPGNRLGM